MEKKILMGAGWGAVAGVAIFVAVTYYMGHNPVSMVTSGPWLSRVGNTLTVILDALVGALVGATIVFFYNLTTSGPRRPKEKRK